MGKVSKQAKKFNQKHLKRTIQQRRAKQEVKRKIDNKMAAKKAKGGGGGAGAGGAGGAGGARGRGRVPGGGEVDDDEEEEDVDELGMAESDGDDDEEDVGELDGEGFDDEDEDEKGTSVGDEDDLEDLDIDDEEAHAMDLAALKERDPEFYKYLEENDRELLEFGGEDADADADCEAEVSKSKADKKKSKKDKEAGNKSKGKQKEIEGGDEVESGKTVEEEEGSGDIAVTKELLRSWQIPLLKHRSVKSLRKVLLAFRSASRMGEDDEDTAMQVDGKSKGKGVAPRVNYVIESPSLFNMVVMTALRYTPIVLAHHLPHKEMPNGKFKIPTQSSKYSSIQRLIRSYFFSLLHLLPQLGDEELRRTAITESSKLIPYVVGNRKVSREFFKALLTQWTGGEDSIRIVAFLAIRKMARAADPSFAEMVLKGSYLGLIRSAKATSAFTLPSINLMKNSASELFLLSPTLSYQLAFGYIRQLAIHLRNSMKINNKDSQKAIYNWQFAHSIDFWSLVLSSACDTQRADGFSDALRPLIFPLVQVTLGAIKLIPSSRYFPFRFHLLRSLLRLQSRTSTYIPLSPYLLDVLDCTELKPSFRPKGSTLRPLDWEYYIRAPKQYQKTRVFADGMVEELGHLILEFHAKLSLSIAFPEVVIPTIVNLRRHAKRSTNSKLTSTLKNLVDKLEANAKWVEERRNRIEFAPGQRQQVDGFLSDQTTAKSPLGTYFGLQQKIREQKRLTLERAAQGDDD